MNKIKQSGFSIVELLIAMVISLTLIFACASVYSSLQNSIVASQGLSTAQESLRTAHYLMSRSVRQGQGIQLSGANNTSREIIVTYGGIAETNDFYGCLGVIQRSGAKDTYLVATDAGTQKNHLYCKSESSVGVVTPAQIIALDVEKLSASLATRDDAGVSVILKGIDVGLAIKGMPGDMATNGFTFSLAMRQRILIDSGVSNASASTAGLISN